MIAPGLDGYIYTSLDHGDTWQKIQPHGAYLGNIRQYLFTPEDQSVLYAATPTGLIRSSYLRPHRLFFGNLNNSLVSNLYGRME